MKSIEFDEIAVGKRRLLISPAIFVSFTYYDGKCYGRCDQMDISFMAETFDKCANEIGIQIFERWDDFSEHWIPTDRVERFMASAFTEVNK